MISVEQKKKKNKGLVGLHPQQFEKRVLFDLVIQYLWSHEQHKMPQKHWRLQRSFIKIIKDEREKKRDRERV